jgi:hypothetical protein
MLTEYDGPRGHLTIREARIRRRRRAKATTTADHLRTDLVAQVLEDAVHRRRPEPEVIFQGL